MREHISKHIQPVNTPDKSTRTTSEYIRLTATSNMWSLPDACQHCWAIKSRLCRLLVSLILKLQDHLPLHGSTQHGVTQHLQHLWLQVMAVQHCVKQAGVGVNKWHEWRHRVSQANEFHGRLGTLVLCLVGRANDPWDSRYKGTDDGELGVWRFRELPFAPALWLEQKDHQVWKKKKKERKKEHVATLVCTNYCKIIEGVWGLWKTNKKMKQRPSACAQLSAVASCL